jgi:hypothetical protein
MTVGIQFNADAEIRDDAGGSQKAGREGLKKVVLSREILPPHGN